MNFYYINIHSSKIRGPCVDYNFLRIVAFNFYTNILSFINIFYYIVEYSGLNSTNNELDVVL